MIKFNKQAVDDCGVKREQKKPLRHSINQGEENYDHCLSEYEKEQIAWEAQQGSRLRMSFAERDLLIPANDGYIPDGTSGYERSGKPNPFPGPPLRRRTAPSKKEVNASPVDLSLAGMAVPEAQHGSPGAAAPVAAPIAEPKPPAVHSLKLARTATTAAQNAPAETSSKPTETFVATEHEAAKDNFDQPTNGDTINQKQPPKRTGHMRQPFPVSSLGSPWAEGVMAITDKLQTPVEMGGQSMLAALTCHVQGHANVNLGTIDNPGPSKPILNYFITVAESGARKSTLDRIVLAPIRQMEQKLRHYYQVEFPKWQVEFEYFQKRKKEIAKISDPSVRRQAATDLGLPPFPPLSPTILLSDPTVEGAAKGMIYGQPIVGIYNDDAGQFLGGYGFSKDNQLKTAAFLSKFWDASPIEMTRAGNGQIWIEGKRVSMHLMVQPEVAADFLNNKVFASQGLLSRFLISYPESTIGTRLSRPLASETEKNILAFQNRLEQIIETPLPLRSSK